MALGWDSEDFRVSVAAFSDLHCYGEWTHVAEAEGRISLSLGFSTLNFSGKGCGVGGVSGVDLCDGALGVAGFYFCGGDCLVRF